MSSGRAADDSKTPITVYDPTYFPQEITETQRGSGSNASTELPDETSRRPAFTSERFAAFLTDALIFCVPAWGWYELLGRILKQAPSWLLLGATAAFLYSVYGFVTEAVFGATPGKRLAGLRVRSAVGGRATLLDVLIRNLARLIDIPLFLVTVVPFLEVTRRRQRLGDLLAGTVVVRDLTFESRRLPPDITPLAEATRRGVAWALDLLLLVPLGYGLLLLIPLDRPDFTAMGVNAVLPTLVVLLALSETFFQTTFGKAIVGIKVAEEDGRPAPFAILLLRNLIKVLDGNPIGFLFAFLSSRRQRPGDMAAGTMVFRDRRGLRGWLSVPLMAGLAILAVHFGLKNPDSLLRRNADIHIGSLSFDPFPEFVKKWPFLNLGIRIDDLKPGSSESRPKPDRTFAPGEAVYLLFRISGYTVQSDKAWIQVDVRVRDGRGNLILDRPKAINSSLNVARRKSADLITRFSLHPQAEAGAYSAELTVRDMFTGKSTAETLAFAVRR